MHMLGNVDQVLADNFADNGYDDAPIDGNTPYLGPCAIAIHENVRWPGSPAVPYWPCEVVRGGGWSTGVNSTTARGFLTTGSEREFSLGFRLVRIPLK